MQNLLFDTHHTLWLFHLFVGNINSECLDFRRHEETRIDFDQSAKSANHKSGADQQDESQRYLEHDERASCPVSMAALAHGTSAFPQRGQLRHPRICESRHEPKSRLTNSDITNVKKTAGPLIAISFIRGSPVGAVA